MLVLESYSVTKSHLMRVQDSALEAAERWQEQEQEQEQKPSADTAVVDMAAAAVAEVEVEEDTEPEDIAVAVDMLQLSPIRQQLYRTITRRN